MQLVIKNGKVISWFHDNQKATGPEESEIVAWQGTPPITTYHGEGWAKTLVFADDPRDTTQKLLSAKQRKLKEINEWDEATRLAGVSIGTYTLRYDEIGQNRIISLLSQVRELADQGLITGDTPVSFEDAQENAHKVKASVIRSAIQTYFSACQVQDGSVSDLKAQLKAASTIEEVEAITVGR